VGEEGGGAPGGAYEVEECIEARQLQLRWTRRHLELPWTP